MLPCVVICHQDPQITYLPYKTYVPSRAGEKGNEATPSERRLCRWRVLVVVNVRVLCTGKSTRGAIRGALGREVIAGFETLSSKCRTDVR